MAQIIKQPNGKYALFSSITDSFLGINLSETQVVKMIADEEAAWAWEQSRKHSEDVLEKIKNGVRPYAQFGLSWEEARAKHKKNNPKPDALDRTELWKASQKKTPL